ncbi:MAG: NAD-dependent DNA ligase LigA [Candidatus Colwellbacteria bacterium]|nr:NAD-dependent DNA ligase LigA [Candidatus Colwellbacteria bacterium]
MNRTEASVRITKLKKEIERYRHAYHVEDKSLISDAAHDSLKRELFRLEQQYPDLITPDSPTQRIGGEPAKQFKKVRHEARMTSFNDAFNEEEIRAWLSRAESYLGTKIKPEFYLELKIDGFAIELVYENGILVQGSTRGDGSIGEDVTDNLRTIEAIPLNLNHTAKINIPPKLIVRGEVFISKEEFIRMNRAQEQRGEKPYANPRNLAAGSIRQLDPKVASSRKLDSFIYSLVTDMGQKTHADEHGLLAKMGFKTDNKHHQIARSLDEVFRYKDGWEGSRRDALPYQIDGVVVIINSNEIYEKLGVVGKTPRGAIAYKFEPEEATTRLIDIRVQVGRTGALTPVAILEPVEVGGVTVKHATLHNFDQIARLGVRIGDTVVISRAGDVIPQITQVLANLRTGKEKKFSLPEKCPIDGSKIVKEGAIHRCANLECGARLREGMSHFVSRTAFDIRGLGAKIIDKFIEEGFLLDPADIFHLDREELTSLPGFGERSADNILSEIEKRKRISLPRLIYSLGILHIGEETSHAFADELQARNMQVRQPSDLIATLGKLSLGELMKIPDVGPKIGESVHAWFRSERNKQLLSRLDKAGVAVISGGISASHKLAGRSFVITGTLEAMSREEAQEKIRRLGGHPADSVGVKTNYVVAGENPGSKLDKAKRLGVQILTEKEFRKMLG